MKELFGKDAVTGIVKGIVGLLIFTCAWFWIAGRVTWLQGWIFLLTFVLYASVLLWRVSRLDPYLIRERNLPSEKAEAWDQLVMRIYTVVLMVLMALCALDGGRFHWSSVPVGIQLAGWGLLVLAGVVIWLVMKTNAYLSSWARLQDERGQVVVQEGLYQRIRHPMYMGIISGFLGLPLALGSWWGLIPAAVIVGLFIYRTFREDQMLIDGLAGYLEYTKKVKYRLLPGIW